MSTLRGTLFGILAIAAACEPPPAPTKADDAGVQDAGTKATGMEQLGDVAKSLEGQDMTAEELAKQPPIGGIFAPGIADKAHPPGAPPTISMIDEGIEPRIALHAASFEPSQTLGMQLELKIQGQAIPLGIVKLDVGPPRTEPEQPKKDDPKDKKGPKPSGSASPQSSAAASASASAPPALELPPGADRPLMVMVTGFTPQGQPDEFRAVIAFTLTKTGPTDFKRGLAGDAGKNPEKAMLYDLELSAIEEVLTALYTPAPPKPVGEKAMWMVTDRRVSFGTDVVRYRAFTLTKIDGDRAQLNVDIRQYAANDQSALLPDDEVAVVGYNAVGKGKLDVVPRFHFPKGGRMQIVVGSSIVPKKSKGDPKVQAKPVNFEAFVQIGELQIQEAPGQPGDKPGEKPGGKPGEKPGKPQKPPSPAPPAPPPP